MRRLAFALVSVLALACGGSTKDAEHASSDHTHSAASSARPSCEAIDEACDPHEDEGGLAKECHDLAESKATTEATCASRKDACLKACPAKK
jgi:hypothetical protein